MTIQTVMTLGKAERAYLRAAIACLLTVQGEAAARDRVSTPAGFCAELRNDLLVVATADGTVSPLDHQQGYALADLLGLAGAIELHPPTERSAAELAGITPHYNDAPGTYTDQVGPDEEVFVVPCKLKITGAETEEAAAVLADTFLGRAMMDATVNADEMVLAFEIGDEAQHFVPSVVPSAAMPGGVLSQV